MKCVSPRNQADYLARYVRLLRERGRLRVSTLLWFSAQDFATPQSASECRTSPKDFYGLYTFEGWAKPSQDRWERVTGTNLPERIRANDRMRGCRGRD